MPTFFNNQSSSNNQPNKRSVACAAAATVIGNVTWIINAINLNNGSQQSLLSCFQNNNITDADRRAVEECWRSTPIAGERASAGCGTEYVYDQYTIDRCGNALNMSNLASDNALFASLFLLAGICITVGYACSQTAGRLKLPLYTVELQPIRTRVATSTDNSSLMPGSNRSAYNTFAMQEEIQKSNDQNYNA